MAIMTIKRATPLLALVLGVQLTGCALVPVSPQAKALVPSPAGIESEANDPVMEALTSQGILAFQSRGYDFYVKVKGARQGVFRPESRTEAYKDAIVGLGFSYGVKSPRDAASGQASGKRTHHPVTFVKEWGPSTPQFFQALVTNEVLESVEMVFVEPGGDRIAHTVKLVNAAVSEINQTSGESNTGGVEGTREAISLTFQRIEISNADGKTMAVDDWAQ